MIVVDTSATVAILQREADGPAPRAGSAGAGRILVSAVSAVDLVAASSREEVLHKDVRDFLNEPFVVVEPVERGSGRGSGRRVSPFRDGTSSCGTQSRGRLAYALARTRGPPLFTWDDSSRTDIDPASGRVES